jgi:hypothetical protein
MLLQVLAHGHTPDPLLPAQPLVQVEEEVPAVVLVVLPGILAVENDRDQVRAVPDAPANAVETVPALITWNRSSTMAEKPFE